VVVPGALRSVQRWVAREPKEGQALVEYALIVCLVVVVILIMLIVLGNQVQNTYCNIMGKVGSPAG
jgi:Flp pilus assembly pilin Flp